VLEKAAPQLEPDPLAPWFPAARIGPIATTLATTRSGGDISGKPGSTDRLPASDYLPIADGLTAQLMFPLIPSATIKHRGIRCCI
jgi:hypothetical protein